MSEKRVTIDGIKLTNAEVTTLRVAITGFLIDLQDCDALGANKHGRSMRVLFLKHARVIEGLLVGGGE